MHLFVRRTLAFGIDYVILSLYGGALYGVTMLLQMEQLSLHPMEGQALGFVTLTLPVFMYFFWFEKIRKATPGKRIMGIQVEGSRILLRNILKFLPWEFGHAGVHWMFYYDNQGLQAPWWEFVLLLVPQAIAAVYIVSILITSGSNSLYDGISGTSIVKNTMDQTTMVSSIDNSP